MDNLSTEQGNALISEFMDVAINGEYIITISTGERIGVGQYKEFLYHTSWDWLMEVVEKIEGLI